MLSAKSLLACLLVVFGTAAAQPPAGPPPGPMMDIARLSVLLDLDAYQEQEVARILSQQRAIVGERRQLAASDERPSFEEMEAELRRAQQELLAELRRVLTERQIEKFTVLIDRPRSPQRLLPIR